MITRDHNCGYTYDIYQEDNEEWYFRQTEANMPVPINYCPMCGIRLNNQYLGRDGI